MEHKYETYRAYNVMLSAGIDKNKILKEIKQSKKAFNGFGIPEEMHYVLLARSLNIDVPKPKQRIKFVPNSPHIQIADIKNVPVGTYVTVKGKIITVFDDEDKVTLNIKDHKTTIRCDLFYDSMTGFRTKGFKKGDIINLNSLKVKEYRGRKELIGNEYTSISKVKE